MESLERTEPHTSSTSTASDSHVGEPTRSFFPQMDEHEAFDESSTLEHSSATNPFVGMFDESSSMPHRDALEAAFGDLSHLDVSVDRDSCEEHGAEAYAEAGRIVTATSTPSLHTMAHEVAHTFQQQPGRHFMRPGNNAAELEVEADRIADRVVAGDRVEPHAITAAPTIGKQLQQSPAVAEGRARGEANAAANHACHDYDASLREHDTRNPPPTSLDEGRVTVRHIDTTAIVNALLSAFRPRAEGRALPDQSDLASQLRSELGRVDTDITAPIDVTVPGTGGGNASLWQCIFHLHFGPATLSGVSNNVVTASSASGQAQGNTTGGAGSISLPPVGITGGSSSTSGSSSASAQSQSDNAATESWRMPIVGGVSWQRRDNGSIFSSANPTPWGWVSMPSGSYFMLQRGTSRTTSCTSQAPAATAPIATPAIPAPAVPGVDLNNSRSTDVSQETPAATAAPAAPAATPAAAPARTVTTPVPPPRIAPARTVTAPVAPPRIAPPRIAPPRIAPPRIAPPRIAPPPRVPVLDQTTD